ncbi:MAG: hypothetical protein HY553_12020 [Elusimicrobia bacterium]|nr:hypothetical protein [Elusimicrobiota bacterium]
MGAWILAALLSCAVSAELRSSAGAPPGEDLTLATITPPKKVRRARRPDHTRRARPKPPRRAPASAQAVALPAAAFAAEPSASLRLDPADLRLLDSLGPGVARDTVRESLWRSLRE